MKRASILLAVAERDSHAFRWLRLAAERRRAGLFEAAWSALLVARNVWPGPKLP